MDWKDRLDLAVAVTIAVLIGAGVLIGALLF